MVTNLKLRQKGQGRPGLAGAFWAQTEQHSGCGAASPSQGPRDPGLGRQPGALPFPRKELSPREALAVCTPPAPKPSARTPGS